ncbi:MAG: zinc ribbon domain-containing protein [Chloroflexi bacterium]|nr:MAG: zinc ribbon domain-containing protein [Chloroflexota bacterium]MBL1197043.1 zinc ribbon domain-containing protein [Chloroflexota bacterium]NOH14338.1 zinc ribbon domain-containing protein [Chloroflexota bacterium]
MPVYTYHCEECEHEFDAQQSFSEDALKKCPNCSKLALRKVYKPARVVFKGSGFYVTDHRSSSRVTGSGSEKDGDKAKSSSNGKSEASSEGAKKSKSKAKKTETPAKSKSEN